jgi:hypothetical protein
MEPSACLFRVQFARQRRDTLGSMRMRPLARRIGCSARPFNRECGRFPPVLRLTVTPAQPVLPRVRPIGSRALITATERTLGWPLSGYLFSLLTFRAGRYFGFGTGFPLLVLQSALTVAVPFGIVPAGLCRLSSVCGAFIPPSPFPGNPALKQALGRPTETHALSRSRACSCRLLSSGDREVRPLPSCGQVSGKRPATMLCGGARGRPATTPAFHCAAIPLPRARSRVVSGSEARNRTG